MPQNDCVGTGNENYYEILGIPKSATEGEIKKAYHDLAKQFHPDKNPQTGSTAKFQRILNAYAILSDTGKRVNYDRSAFHIPPPNQPHFNNVNYYNPQANYGCEGGNYTKYTFGFQGGSNAQCTFSFHSGPFSFQTSTFTFQSSSTSGNQHFNMSDPNWLNNFFNTCGVFGTNNHGNYSSGYQGYYSCPGWGQSPEQIRQTWERQPSQEQKTEDQRHQQQQRSFEEMGNGAERKKMEDERRRRQGAETAERRKRETEEAQRQFKEKMQRDAAARAEKEKAEALEHQRLLNSEKTKRLQKQVQLMRFQRLAEEWEKERLKLHLQKNPKILYLIEIRNSSHEIPKSRKLTKMIQDEVNIEGYNRKYKTPSFILGNLRELIRFEKVAFRQRQRDEILLMRRDIQVDVV